MPSDVYKFEASELVRAYGHGSKRVVAVDRVALKIREHDVVSLVGQSGCGKTVLARMLLRLEPPTSGSLSFDGRPLDAKSDPRDHWRRVQAVFQDPFAAFNQFFTIRAQLRSSFRLFKTKPPVAEIEERIDGALLAVNIKPKDIEGKYPFELSGGQMQRMLLARIFILKPEVLIADEPTSMVDACSRASILDYLMKLKEELQMTIVFVTHDIGLAYYISNELFIMHKGQIVEHGSPEAVIHSPTSEITKELLADIPQVNRDWIPRSTTARPETPAFRRTA
jgi:peptide/nickel transport system ATP-binding protein